MERVDPQRAIPDTACTGPNLVCGQRVRRPDKDPSARVTEMDIVAQPRKLHFIFNQQAFEASLKEMPGLFSIAIEPIGEGALQPAHPFA